MIFSEGTELLAGDYTEENLAFAREYISQRKYTVDDVRIVKRVDMLLVITKRRIIA